MSKLFALIRHKFGKNPEELTEEQFADYAAEALWLVKYESELFELATIKAIATILSKK